MDARSEIEKQVSGFLGKSEAFKRMPASAQREIFRDTARIVETMAQAKERAPDPFAHALANITSGGISTGEIGPIGQNPTNATGNVASMMQSGPGGKLGDSIQVGVDQAARMVNEIDFPTFVAKLIEGTFHAIVKSSIEQMKAYADMVKSVATTLNEFKDRNTTDNQAADHLVSRYPQIFQINIVDNAPKVGVRDDADTDHLPDFKKDFGLGEAISDLDEETIQSKLIPAARDDLARGRQQLLATIILMGINRIVVTDGKINAKIRFQFSATEKRKVSAQAYDYATMGTTVSAAHQSDSGTASDPSQQQGNQPYTLVPGPNGTQQYIANPNYQAPMSGDNRYATGQDSVDIAPDVRVTSQVDMSSDAKIQASGQIMGEVSVNFKSETFPLEKMVNADQMFKIQEAGNGRGSLPAAAPGAVPSAAAPGAVPSAAASGAATGAPATPPAAAANPPAKTA